MRRNDESQRSSLRGVSNWGSSIAWVVAGLLAVGLILVSGLYIARPPESLSEEPPTLLAEAEAEAGSIGSTLRLNAIAEWTVASTVSNGASGVVTSNDVAAGDSVASGQQVYSVNLTPVYAGEGSVPSFRDISEGTSGRDVEQLQQFLLDEGVYFGPVDGTAGPGTKSSISAWQEANDLPRTGVMDRRSVLYVPTLPTRLRLDQSILSVGSSVMGGEKAIQILDAQPKFTIAMTETQASTVSDGTSVEIVSPSGEAWSGLVSSRDSEAISTPVLNIGPSDGSESVCGESCSQIAQGVVASLPAIITTKEEVSGVVVPSSALITEVDGSVSVESETGERRPVTVVDSANGQSVVEGIDPGDNVKIPTAVG